MTVINGNQIGELDTELKVLLVDDDENTQKTLALILERKGYQIIKGRTGREALELARAQKINLAMVDIRLPDTDGVKLIAPLKETNNDMAVLMITGFASVGTAVQALQKGAAGYITKPVNIDELLIQVRDIFEKISLAEKKRQAEIQRDAIMEALRKERDFAESLIETAQAIVLVLDPEGRIIRFNRFLEQISGYRLEEVQGKDWITTFLPERSRKVTRGLFLNAVRDIPTRGNIDSIITWDGDERLIEWYDKTLKDSSGNVIGLLAIGMDITEREVAYDEIRRHVGRMQALLEVDKALISALNLNQTLDIILEKLESVIPFDSAAIYLISNGIARVAAARGHLDPEGILKISFPIEEDELLVNILQTQSSLVLHDAQTDERFISRGGTNYVRSWIGVPLVAGKSVIGFLTIDNNEAGVYNDTHAETAGVFAGQTAIAIQKADLMENTREQARQMQEILETVPEGVLVLDNYGWVVLVNPTAERYLDRLAGDHSRERITHLGDRALADLLAPPPEGLWHQVWAAGRTYQVVARPMQLEPGKSGWVLVVKDVTKEKELQQRVQQQERLAAVGQLAAGIAHDFNNLMAVIVLSCQMALQLELPPKAREWIKTAIKEVKKGTDLISQILDFSRLTSLELRQMNLLLLLKEQVKLLGRTIPENIKIKLTYDANEYIINTDPIRIQQVMMNLVVNARDAIMGREGGIIEIAMSQMEPGFTTECTTCGTQLALDRKWARMTVTDNGDGIKPDVLPHIFEPFFTTKPLGEGTGLGLAQVYGIINQHEGHIMVSSQLGKGTTFTIYLPLTTPLEPSSLPGPDSPLMRGEGQTLLVVEDNHLVREAIAVGLESLGYKVIQAESGAMGLQILNERVGEISLVLTDMVMPQMGGEGFIQAMRDRSIALPVVVMSGYVMEGKREVLEKLGGITFLQKPSELGTISQVVARALGRR